MVANSVYMKISDCPGRVSVAQRSAHRSVVDMETLGSIPGWGSQSFRLYNYKNYDESTMSMSITRGLKIYGDNLNDDILQYFDI